MKRVLITGGNRGLGLELVRQMSARGDRVLATVRRADDAIRLPSNVEMREVDVENAQTIAALEKSLEGQSIDLLINNAGVGESSFYDNREGPGVAELDFDAVSQMLAINTVGPMRVLAAALPAMRRGKGRKVINISSELGSIAQNTRGGWIGYRLSKAALNMFTRCVAGELGAEGFVCASLHPGWVRTDMGGSEAPLSAGESVDGMLQVIDALNPAQNGRFLAWDGSELPW